MANEFAVMEQRAEPQKGRWVDRKPRCPLCRIVLVDGVPPSPCRRATCRFMEPEKPDDSAYTLTGCSLGGEDYALVEGEAH